MCSPASLLLRQYNFIPYCFGYPPPQNGPQNLNPPFLGMEDPLKPYTPSSRLPILGYNNFAQTPAFPTPLRTASQQEENKERVKQRISAAFSPPSPSLDANKIAPSNGVNKIVSKSPLESEIKNFFRIEVDKEFYTKLYAQINQLY